MPSFELIEQLHHQLQRPLPGKEAQYRMAHKVRRGYVGTPFHARQAGVLILFYPKADDWHLVFIERSSRNRQDRHAGQISFPGGKYEPNDGDLETTALREAEEEIAAPRKSITTLGRLSELYIPVSNFAVHPYVAYTDQTPSFVAQETEVRNILEVPFDFFRNPSNISQTDMQITKQLVLRGVPYFDLEGKVLWGATAMMMGELLAVTEAALAS